MTRLIIRNIGKLYTLADSTGQPTLDPLVGAELVIEDGRVASVSGRALGPAPAQSPAGGNPYPQAPAVTKSNRSSIEVDAEGALVTPGLVDPHTHVVYAGNRASESALKQAGVPYLDILARGGGILSTVRATREATDEQLLRAAEVRLRTMLSMGTTSVEVKTGYGLSTEQEIRLLDVVAELQKTLPMTIVPTFLGAHATPPEYMGKTSEYVDMVCDEMLPAVAAQNVGRFCDVFCEPGVFSIDQSRRVLQSGKEHGLLPRIHADEIEAAEGVTGAELAAEVGAISADHLRASTRPGLQALSDAGVIPVLLPATAFNLGDGRYPDARTMLDEFHLPVALATDDNPGTSPTESLQLVMAIAAIHLRMTPEETLAAVTINAARAIDISDEVGSLEPGKLGDAVIWQAYDLDLVPYRFGVNQAAMVIRGGEIQGRG